MYREHAVSARRTNTKLTVSRYCLFPLPLYRQCLYVLFCFFFVVFFVCECCPLEPCFGGGVLSRGVSVKLDSEELIVSQSLALPLESLHCIILRNLLGLLQCPYVLCIQLEQGESPPGKYHIQNNMPLTKLKIKRVLLKQRICEAS